MKVLNHLSNTTLKAKQGAYFEAHKQMKEEKDMANDNVEGEVEAPEPADETKAARFSRVVNPRVKAAVRRLRLIKQMFEGQNGNNYEFTEAQRDRLIAVLTAEVDEIAAKMAVRLNGAKADAVEDI